MRRVQWESPQPVAIHQRHSLTRQALLARVGPAKRLSPAGIAIRGKGGTVSEFGTGAANLVRGRLI